jgi:hypothetical protein
MAPYRHPYGREISLSPAGGRSGFSAAGQQQQTAHRADTD